MRTVRAYIGLGSNLDGPVSQVRAGLDALASVAYTTVVARSSLYRSRPMGSADQPDYVNAVALLETALEVETLLGELQALERAQGRLRETERWSPRTLDLDILLFGDLIIDSPNLIIPHSGLCEREFVLYPLQEIAPALRLPDGSALAEWVQRCPDNGLVRLNEM